MNLSSFTSVLGRFFRRRSDADLSLTSLNLEPQSSSIIDDRLLTGLDRPLTLVERAIAEWLLLHADPPATNYLQQLDAARIYDCAVADVPPFTFAFRKELRELKNDDGILLWMPSGKLMAIW